MPSLAKLIPKAGSGSSGGTSSAGKKARTTRGELAEEEEEEEEGCWSPDWLSREREQAMVEKVRTTGGELSREEAKEEGEGGCRDRGRLDRKREGAHDAGKEMIMGGGGERKSKS
ncbi:hypothetical protein BHE74_00021790 [Ensete ventricosum]|nr:hypothetical protein BHE74_00021790 [Ensete ventricosum]